MPATPAQLFAFFDKLDINHATVEHPPLFTVEDGREWWGKIPGLHCKNLFLKGKSRSRGCVDPNEVRDRAEQSRPKEDKIWLVVMPGDKRADINRIEKSIGSARLSFGKPELLLEVMGLTPGSVTPFGLINDAQKRITLVIDSDLLKAEQVNFHPLHNAASTTIKSDDLLKFARALGYEPVILGDAA